MPDPYIKLDIDHGVINFFHPETFIKDGVPCMAITVELMKKYMSQYDDEVTKLRAFHPVKVVGDKLEGASWSEFLKTTKKIEEEPK